MIKNHVRLNIKLEEFRSHLLKNHIYNHFIYKDLAMPIFTFIML